MAIGMVEAEQQARLYLFLVPHWSPIEVIVVARALNMDSTGGGKHYATRSDPSYISRTDRL